MASAKTYPRLRVRRSQSGILNISGHVIAVVNGVVMDSHKTGSSAGVHAVWYAIPVERFKVQNNLKNN